MKDIRLGKYLISFSIASGNTLGDKHFLNIHNNLFLVVYTLKSISALRVDITLQRIQQCIGYLFGVS